MNAKNKKFYYTDDTLVSDPDYEALSDEEKLWDRLRHGIRTKSISAVIAEQLAAEMREEIDAEILEALKLLATDE